MIEAKMCEASSKSAFHQYFASCGAFKTTFQVVQEHRSLCLKECRVWKHFVHLVESSLQLLIRPSQLLRTVYLEQTRRYTVVQVGIHLRELEEVNHRCMTRIYMTIPDVWTRRMSRVPAMRSNSTDTA